MFSLKSSGARLAAMVKANLLANLFNLQARSGIAGSKRLTKQLFKSVAPVVPLFGWGRESRGPHPRHPMWPLNHYSTKWHPTARNGSQECARRRRQIERGQLTAANGLHVA